MMEPLPVHTRAFLLVCALAGGLAVPLHPLASPVSTAVGGLLGLLGLRVWRWSGLPDSIGAEAPRGLARLVQPALSMGCGLLVGLVLGFFLVKLLGKKPEATPEPKPAPPGG